MIRDLSRNDSIEDLAESLNLMAAIWHYAKLSGFYVLLGKGLMDQGCHWKRSMDVSLCGRLFASRGLQYPG